MRALSNLKGRWNPQRMCIEFTWDVAGLGNDRFIYIFPLFEQNGSKRIDMRRYSYVVSNDDIWTVTVYESSDGESNIEQISPSEFPN